jgi:hypothetical protein
MSDRFCKDCRHINMGALTATPLRYATCAKADPIKSDTYLVDGLTRQPFCEVMRMSINACGPNGEWFEPKEPA